MADMDTLAAARGTLELARTKGFDNQEPDVPALDFPDLLGMVERMATTPMDEGKRNRWLGWIQAAVVSGTMGEVSLDDCKRINKEHLTEGGA